MKSISKSISLFILFISINVFGQNSFPTNTDGSLIDTVNVYTKNNKLKLLDGKFYAFDAKVIKVHKAYQKKPYYLVEFSNGNRIWIASLINSGYEKKGNVLRLLGVFSLIKDDDEISKKYNKTDYHILLFALVDIESKQASMLPAAKGQGKEWMNGTIPKDLRPE